MESIRYSARRFAEVLGLSPQQLTEAESRGPLSRMRAESPQRTMYTVDDLARARAALGRQPARRPMRRQLFLNFKGGTGKTSVSSSYAYALTNGSYNLHAFLGSITDSGSWLSRSFYRTSCRRAQKKSPPSWLERRGFSETR